MDVIDNIKNEPQDWIFTEERAGRIVDSDRINMFVQQAIKRRNSKPRTDCNGLSSEEMFNLVYHPFDSRSAVLLKTLYKEQYEKIPLIMQVLVLLKFYQ